jgi:MOSC domain-containing protein YiiM
VNGRVVTLQVGQPGTLPWRGRQVRTAIFKTPVEGAVTLTPTGFEGDVQADLRYHGGPDKAVCVYPTEHRPEWEELVGEQLPPGAFGENLSTAGLLESGVHVGDVMTAGTATVQVSQPRGPCFKLAARWGKRRLPARMAKEMRSGFYLRVLKPGAVAAGDELRLVERVSDVPIAEVMRVTYVDRKDMTAIQRVLDVPELADQWRGDLEELAKRNLLPFTPEVD